MIWRDKFIVLWIPSLVLGCLGAVTSGCGSEEAPPPLAANPTNPDNVPSQPPPSEGPPPDTEVPLEDGADIGGFPSAKKCEKCHQAIYDEWTASMHSHADTSPVTIAQLNQVVAQELIFESDPDPQQLCTNCHSPIPALITGSATLPFEDARYSKAALNEGITCATCHKYDVNKTPVIGYGATTEFQRNFNSGPFMFGPFGDPKDNGFHLSAKSSLLADDDDSDKLCFSCHEVGLDLNKDGDITVGEDFVLQNTVQEYLDYQARGGGGTCVSCHMPARTGQAADVPGAPVRQIRSHIFLGVDYPLDEVARGEDRLKSAREELMSHSAQIDIVNVDFADNVLHGFDVTIENTGGGHNFPTGFNFMRQAWLEVQVTDPTDRLAVFTSGVLKIESNDLCDLNTLDDNGILSTIVQGCDNEQDRDDFLVNLQTKLLDDVDIVNGQVLAAAGASEVWLQLLNGGAVTRTRPIDGKVLAPLKPFEKQSYSYPLGAITIVPGSKIKVRLLFRNLPPYMVRQIGNKQARDELQIAPLATSLQVTEVDKREVTLR